jgi:hypothetical protein|tara:strand:- start:2702 stop:3094 length:393 start_codon:yes stop_codon:yes gene_type:complete
MFGLIKSIFSSGDTTGKVVDGVLKAGDALVFTSEEKSAASQTRMDWYLKYLEATLPNNLSRRFLAFVVAGVWLLLVVVTAGLAITAALTGSSEWADAYKSVYAIQKEFVLIPFGGIMAFYFATHLLKARK